MKDKAKFLIVALFLSLIFSVGAVCAHENMSFEQSNVDVPVGTVDNGPDINQDNNNDDNGPDINQENNNDDNGPDSSNNVVGAGNENFIVKTEHNVTGNTFQDIQNAINDADDEDTLYLMGGNYTGDGNRINIGKSLTIVGGFQSGDGIYATLDGKKLSQILEISGNNVVIQGIKFINGDSMNGGAIYVTGGCTLIDCIFTNNKAFSYGGAVFWETNAVGITNCTFENNRAGYAGGANHFDSAVTNVNLIGNFNNNSAEAYGGANHFNRAVTNVTLTGNFTNNNVENYDGGANYFWNTVTNVNLTGNFINNSAEDGNGGANYFWSTVTNVNLAGNFTDNRATWDGGANYFNQAVTNVTLTGNFINNSAEDGNGGVNYFNHPVTNVTLTGNFTNNSADNGGANYFNYVATNVNLTGDFINNFAKYNGGANRFWVEVTNVNIIGNFNNNRANVSGSANCFSNAVTNATLTGNYINNTGSSVIYISNSVSGNVIRDSIFINNDPIEITHGNITAVDNWFGNNATDYNVKPDAGIDLDNWLFLNGTASPNPVSVFDTSNIIFKLSRYDETGISPYDNSRLIPITLNITSTLGRVNKNQTKLNESLTYTPDSGGNGSITASFENVLCSIELEILKEEPDMSFESDYSYAGENATIFIYLQSDAGGNVTVTDADGNNYTETVIDGTAEIVVSNLNAGVNKFNITYSGDDRYFSETTEYEIEVEAMPTFLSVESFEMYQGDGTKYMVNLTDINGKPVAGMGIKVNITGKTYTIITDENGTAVLPINLKAGIHPATAFFNGKGGYANATPVSTNVTILTKVRIDQHKDLIKDYGDADKFTVHAVDKFGKSVGAYAKVKMTIAGKTYTVCTDENGYASLPINLKPGTYDITCEYAGYTVKHKVTVKQVLSATNRQYKKASSYQFTATLKHSNGKAISGKTVTFTFKGKTYTATTNSKGEATITIKEALSLGTYNIAIKYLDSTITKTITIK